MGAFLCQHEASKITNTIVRNSFSAVVYRACNITHTIEKPIATLSVSFSFFFSFFFFFFFVFVVLFVSCYICVSYLPLTLIGYNRAMNKILF